jgi:hypothetical protein
MPDPHNAAETAERLKREFGDRALAVVGVRVEEARQASDREGIGLWNEVARRLVAMPGPRKEIRVSERGERPLWWLMQRIEYYRHHALEAERRADDADSEERRQHMLDLAMGWRELALQADLLARGPERPRRRRASRRHEGRPAGRSTR